jgi:hypothetical protein
MIQEPMMDPRLRWESSSAHSAKALLDYIKEQRGKRATDQSEKDF